MSDPRRVLLTGATGFIGQHLHRHLLDAGCAVRALVRPGSPARSRLDPRCEVVTGPLTDAAAVAAAVEDVQAVIYGAGAVRGRTVADFATANVAGVATVAAAAAAAPLRPRIVLLSSLAASRPALSPYARSKRDGERVLEQAPTLRWTILRPPAVYGPGDTEMRPLLDAVRRGVALRPGPVHQRLSLIHVEDLVRAVAAVLQAPETCDHRTFAIDDGTPGGYGWPDIARAVTTRRVRQLPVPGWLLAGLAVGNELGARLLGYAPMLSRGKVRELQQAAWLCDNRAFIEATGWRPRIDLATGAATLYG